MRIWGIGSLGRVILLVEGATTFGASGAFAGTDAKLVIAEVVSIVDSADGIATKLLLL